MGIKFRCRACDRKLHVKTYLAGKRGICPKCGSKIDIPGQSELANPKVQQRPAQVTGAQVSVKPAPGEPSSVKPATGERTPGERATGRSRGKPSAPGRGTATPTLPRSVPPAAATAPTTADPIAESPEAVWYVRPSAGGQYGPADGTIMRRWLAEGRVGTDALVWREGWPDWKSAGPIFGELLKSDLLKPDVPEPDVPEPDVPEPDVPEPDVLKSDLPQTIGASQRLTSDFSLPEKPGVSERWKGRTRQHKRKYVAAIAALSLIFVGMLVALFLILSRWS